MTFQKARLGDVLLQEKLITQRQLEQAIQHQKREGGKLGKAFIQLGILTEDQILKALAAQLKIPFVDLNTIELNEEIVRLLPETLARRFRAIVLKDLQETYLVGLVDPLDIHAYDELSRALRRRIELAIVREQDLLRAINLRYRHQEELTGFAEALSHQLREAEVGEIDLIQISEELASQEAPVVKLLQTLFEDAIQIKASDIHIEPGENVLRIRMRVDGILHEREMPELRIAPALIQRLKLMAELNISERRLPQDGRFSIRVKDQSIDVRLSTMPIRAGEAVVLRLLNQSVAQLQLSQLGMPDDILKQLYQIIHRPHGVILVTGPTGSGKTTTLYSMLNELNSTEKKIITVEDPVEYHMERINQVQVNSQIDLTFARILRTALRHDPDILLVGEIRDSETASIALRAAITGHLVFATLHTNDAASSIMRLTDMGVERFLISAALQAVLAQRLLRQICSYCKTEYQLNLQEKAWLQNIASEHYQDKTFFHGSGCTHCSNTGYSGRIGIYDLLLIDKVTLEALRSQDPAEFLKVAQKREGIHSLSWRAFIAAREGKTTLSEVMRVTGEIEEL